MMQLIQRPIMVAALCLVSGYAIAYHWHPGWLNASVSLVALLACAAIWYRKPKGCGAWVAVLLIAAAMGWYSSYEARNTSAVTLTAEQAEGAALQGRIITPVEVDGDRVSFQVEAEQLVLPPGFTAGAVDGVAVKGERFQATVRLLAQEEQSAAASWRRGDRIGLKGVLQRPAEAGNFGAFDYRRYLRSQHVHGQLTAKGLDGSVQVTPPRASEWGWWRILRWNDGVRDRLSAQVERLFPESQSGFMKGMLVGLTDDIDPQQFDRFSRLGLTHIIAISGLNVAIFLGCLIWVLRRLGMTREAYLKTALLMIPIYILITGGSPSIVRAGVMAMLGLYAAYRNRLKDGLHIALAAGAGMLLVNPYYLTDISFQLSYLVTLGMILFVPRVDKLLPIRWPKLRGAVAVALVAQIISFPLTIYYFNQFSLLSLAANLALVPVYSIVVMPAGTAAMLLGLMYAPAGLAAAWPVARVNDALFWLIGQISAWRQFETIWQTPSGVWMTLYYAAWTALVLLLEAQLRLRKADVLPVPMLETVAVQQRRYRFDRWNARLLIPAAAVVWLGVLGWAYAPHDSGLQGMVQFLDIGQGDSILIRSPAGGRHMLIDGGGTVTFRKPGEAWKQRRDPYEVGRKLLVPLLKQRGVQRLDEVILTHQDADHFGGLQAVLEQIPVSRLVFNGTLKREPAVEKLFNTALARGVRLVEAKAGDRLTVDSGTTLDFVYPLPDDSGGEGITLEKEQNASSLVFLMTMHGTRWLFTGDIGEAEERRMLDLWSQQPKDRAQPWKVGPIDVLKVAHHGSKSSSSEEWLRFWKPKLAVISVGAANSYGHPSPLVLKRLQAHDTGVLRTDRDGEVQIAVRGGKLEMRHKRE